MPKVNVYLPDALAERVRAAGLPVSAICQAALTSALDQTVNWQDTITQKDLDLPEPIAFELPVTNHLVTVINLAYSLARARHSASVRSEHLLLGLLEEGENLALKVLESANVNLNVLRKDVTSATPKSTRQRSMSQVKLCANARTIIESTGHEAVLMSRPFIGSEHLLLALLHNKTGGAGAILRTHGLELAATRKATQTMLTGSSFGHWNTASIQQSAIERRLSEMSEKLDWVYELVRGQSPLR